MMRGGNTQTTLVLGRGPIASPPTVERAWAVALMHREYAGPTLDRVRDGGLVFTNADVVPEGLVAEVTPRARELRVPATQAAIEMGDIVAATMVMMGALVGATGLVSIEAMCAAVAPSLPPYRQQVAQLNESAIRLGASIAPTGAPRAWQPEPAWP
jgi:Pyruvate/2-oxoacid:ferredoxin oxidoreductase gamma subunit